MHLDGVQMKAIQLRMARAALEWGVRDLAKKSGITANTISRIENGSDAKQSTMDALRVALEQHVIFLDDGATTPGGPGVRLRDK
jgi:transcriptional regulator with XRE-family HTH domain